MTTFYEFASSNPWLTFFLVYLVLGTISDIARAFAGRKNG